MNYSYVLDKDQYTNQIIESITSLSNVIDSENVSYSSSLITDKVVTSLRYAQQQQGVPGIFEGMLLESCYKAEIAGAGSAALCAVFSTALILEVFRLSQSGYRSKDILGEVQEDYRRFHSNLQKLVNDPTESSLYESIQNAVEDSFLSAMIVEAINLAGIEGTIFPEHTHTLIPSVELINGYRFKITGPRSFYENGKWKRQYPKILIVDGIIERVSEVHGILEKASETREPIAFITRGFGEEVIMTLKVNQNRRTLDIIPIAVPFDLEGINMVNDISIVCGVEVVSPLKGNLISSVKYDDLKSVDLIDCHDNLLTILKTGTEKNVANHVQFLMKKQAEQSVEDVSDLLLTRIRSLSSYCVRLRVASKTEQQKMKDLEAIDIGLRTVRSVMSHGSVDISTIEESDISVFGSCWNKIKAQFGYMPTVSVLSAVHHAVSLLLMTCSVERAILQTQ